jgi:hypothetical protein
MMKFGGFSVTFCGLAEPIGAPGDGLNDSPKRGVLPHVKMRAKVASLPHLRVRAWGLELCSSVRPCWR